MHIEPPTPAQHNTTPTGAEGAVAVTIDPADDVIHVQLRGRRGTRLIANVSLSFDEAARVASRINELLATFGGTR